MIESAAFLLYIFLLALADGKRRQIPLILILAGLLGGLLLRVAACLGGRISPEESLWRYGPGLVLGLLLWLMVKVSREAIGKGDALCFISFGLWREVGFLFSLLFGAALLLSLWGLGLMLFRGKKRNLRLPLMPFAAAVALVLTLLEAIPAASP